LIAAAPSLLGLGYAVWKTLRNFNRLDLEDSAELAHLSLLALAGSWMLWYLLFSNGGDRYLATPSFLSAIFVATLISDSTAQFNLRETVNRAVAFITLRAIRLPEAKAFTVIMILGAVTVVTLDRVHLSVLSPDDSVVELALYINKQTSSNAVIESYDSELFFFLDRPYHFPPDQLHVDLLRRYLLDPYLPVAYDPLTADPDYLVIGPLSAAWRLYDDRIVAGSFKLVRDFPRYRLYERVR
jgi:hypothetical protein